MDDAKAFDPSLVSPAGKKGPITGIANDRSIAWGRAEAFRFLGADRRRG
jgi:enoyl-[acyl-carrier-protein] reductase (NADH)